MNCRDDYIVERREQIARFVSQMTDGSHEAEDLTHDALVKAWLAWDTFRGPDAARLGWLYRIARNVALDWRRRRKWVGASLDDPEGWLAEPRAPGHFADEAAVRVDLDRLLCSESVQNRTILVGKAQGFTSKEIGQTVGLSHTAVRARLFRARQRLAA